MRTAGAENEFPLSVKHCTMEEKAVAAQREEDPQSPETTPVHTPELGASPTTEGKECEAHDLAEAEGGLRARHKHTNKDKHKKREKPRRTRQRLTVRHIPWRQKPAHAETGEWFRHGGQASKWFGLFYDLLMVSVLSTFSSQYELRQPDVIVPFLSYYAVIMWVWKTQVHYDVKYEGEDNYHRIAKAIQIAIFAFIGAAAGGWNLSKLLKVSRLDIDVVSTTTLTAHELAGSSFLTVGVAFVISRVVLAQQYVWVVRAGKQAGRSVRNPTIAVWANMISAVITAVAIGIPARNKPSANAKIAMFYLGITVEAVATWGVPLFLKQTVYAADEIAERYAALSLIIIGEGFTGLVGALSKGIKNLHVTEASVYAQAFLVIVIIFNLYLFLFQHFGLRPESVSARRTTWWELVHFPLHFAMLLLLAAMTNTIILQNYFNGVDSTLPYWIEMTDSLRNHTEQTTQNYLKSAIYLQRLNLQPDFDTMYADLEYLYNTPNSTTEPDIRFLLYTGTVMRGIYKSAGFELNTEAGKIYSELMFLDDTRTANMTDNDRRSDEASNLALSLQAELANSAVQGVLWLFPTAGTTVILSAIRSMIRYRFQGAAHYIIHVGQMVCGVALSLLGLLNIGSESVFQGLSFDLDPHIKPLYKLVETDWALPIIVFCYTIVNVASMITAWVAARRRSSNPRIEAAQDNVEPHDSE